MTKVMISAGEASGDIHAGAIAAALKNIDKNIEVFGMGGDVLRASGGEVLFDIKEHGVMGFIEVLKKLPDIFKLKKSFAQVMDERKPDCVVLVDYPGFNKEVAKLAKERNIPTVSFFAPSAWAWKKGRAKTWSKLVTVIASVFPFEYEVYKAAGANIEFVGHPLVDIVKPSMSKSEAEAWAGKRPGHRMLLLMPGSRLMEIERTLPTLLEAGKLVQKQHPDMDLVLPRAGTIPMELLESKIKASGAEVRITEGHNYDLFSVADLALATSGTVTLEAALLGLGSVICYQTSAITGFIAKLVVNIPFIGLPNIVAGRAVLPEQLLEDFTPQKVAKAALELLEPKRYEQMQQDLAFVRERLGEPGAVNRVAQLILRYIEEKR